MNTPIRSGLFDAGSVDVAIARQNRASTGPARTVALLPAILALSACGSAIGLKPADGEHLPVAPVGARDVPTADQLLTPTSQARPQRSDELLKNSEQRRSDPFDLPPD